MACVMRAVPHQVLCCCPFGVIVWVVERLKAGSHCQADHGSGFSLEQRAEAGAVLTIEGQRLRARRRINPGRAIDRYARAALGSPNAFDRDLLGSAPQLVFQPPVHLRASHSRVIRS